MLPAFSPVIITSKEAPIYATDFGEYPVGAQPADWTERYNTSAFSTSVVTVAGSISGKALRWTKTAANRQGFSWDKIPAAADVEILLRARSIEAMGSPDNIIGPYCRGGGSAGTEAGYRFEAVKVGAAPGWAGFVDAYSAGTPTGIGGQEEGPSPTFAQNAWFYMRFRVVGTSLKTRLWHSGAAEPGTWLHSITDATVASAGWTGMQQVSDNPNAEIDYFAASIARGSTPPRTIPVPV